MFCPELWSKHSLFLLFRFGFCHILVKNWAWSPSSRSVPLPFPPSCFFTSTFYINWGYHFFLTSREVLYMVATVLLKPLILAPILGEISGLVCDLEAKTSQNYCFFYTNAQIGSVRSCSNGLKIGMNIGLYMGQILEKIIWWSLTQKKKFFWGPKSCLWSSPAFFFAFFRIKEST